MAEAQAAPVTKEDLVSVVKEVVGEARKPPEKPKTRVGSFAVPNPAAAEPSDEDRARTLGWKPKEEFEAAGKDPSQWRDAKAFLDFGEKQTPILRDNVKTLETKVARMEREREQERAEVQDLIKFRFGAETRAKDAVMAELKARRKEAVDKGDGEGFEQAEAQIADLEKKGQPAERPAAKPNPLFEEWKGKNLWFAKDVEMTETAEAYAIVLKSRGQQPGQEFLDKVTAHVKKVHRDKFQTDADDESTGGKGLTPPVESGNVRGRSATARRSYEALPPEAKKACDKFVAKGWMTVQQYLDDYDWS